MRFHKTAPRSDEVSILLVQQPKHFLFDRSSWSMGETASDNEMTSAGGYGSGQPSRKMSASRAFSLLMISIRHLENKVAV
jgi:hypothetical protein